MKFIFFFCCLFLANTQLTAQQEQTIFKKSHLRGAWGGANFTTASLGSHKGYGAGGSGGLVFNGFSIGAFGQFEAFDGFLQDNQEHTFALAYNGLFLGYSFPTQKSLHLFASAKIGGGCAGLARRYSNWSWDINENDLQDVVFVAVPEIGLELNLTHWMRLNCTVGYRYVDGFQGVVGLGSKDLNAVVYGLNLRFGWFGHSHGQPYD